MIILHFFNHLQTPKPLPAPAYVGTGTGTGWGPARGCGVPSAVWEPLREVWYQLLVTWEIQAAVLCDFYSRTGVGRVQAGCWVLAAKFIGTQPHPLVFVLFVAAGLSRRDEDLWLAKSERFINLKKKNC